MYDQFLPSRGRYFSGSDLPEHFAFLPDEDPSSLVMPRARPILVATYSQAKKETFYFMYLTTYIKLWLYVHIINQM